MFGDGASRKTVAGKFSRLRNFTQLLRYLRALPTIQVHPKLDGRMLDIVHCLNVRIH